MGLHQGQPAGGTKNLSNSGDTPQVKTVCSILDLSFNLQLKQGGIVLSVKSTTIKTAPKGAINQLSHSLTRIIHAFAEAEEDARIFMAKWDIRWVLEIGRGRKRQMEFFLCVTPAPRRTNLPRGAHLTSNGMGGITPILLRGFGNSTGCRTGLLGN